MIRRGGKMKRIITCAAIMLMAASGISGYAISGLSITDKEGVPVRLTGINAPYLPMLDEPEIKAGLDLIKRSGVKVVRVFASFCGNKSYSIQTGLGKYNDMALETLDFTLAEIGVRGMKAIVVLSDSNKTYGGKEVYAQWVGGSNEDVFFKDKICREYFKQFITMILDRKNTLTGIKYKKDPNIFAWDLCNDAENKSDETGAAIYKWAGEMSGFIKADDKMHPVIMGVKKIVISDDEINAYDLFLVPGLDAAYITLKADAKIPPNTALNYIKRYTAAFYAQVNKPVFLNFSDITGGASATMLSDAARSFFESNGSLIIYNYAGLLAYKKYPGALDLENDAVTGELLKAAEISDEFRKDVPAIAIKSVKVSAEPYSAKITFDLSEKTDAEVLYGESMPLKTRAKKAAAEELSQSVRIDGLKANTKYFYIVKAGSSAKAGVTKVNSFMTSIPERIPAVPFKRSKNFITVKGTQFFDGDKPYKYVGTNCYYLRYTKDKSVVDYVMREASRMGFKVIRVGSNGEAVDEKEASAGDPLRYLRIGPDKFNEKAYKGLDYVIDSARRNNMRVILHFSDNWEYYGGLKVYAKWAGLEDKNAVFTNELCRKYFKQTIDALVKRKNTYSKIDYKDDPTIFAYDLSNEPRDENDPTGKELNGWIAEMSAYVKSLDKKHLVTTGSEGFFLKEDGTHYGGADFITEHQIPTIDFCTYHVYPSYEHNNYSLKTTKWMIDRWVKTAHETIGKPVVMEEYGIPSKNPDFPKATWIREMTNQFFNDGGDGVNYWFLIDPSYSGGDGFEVTPDDTEYVNEFIKVANTINKDGY